MELKFCIGNRLWDNIWTWRFLQSSEARVGSLLDRLEKVRGSSCDFSSSLPQVIDIIFEINQERSNQMEGRHSYVSSSYVCPSLSAWQACNAASQLTLFFANLLYCAYKLSHWNAQSIHAEEMRIIPVGYAFCQVGEVREAQAAMEIWLARAWPCFTASLNRRVCHWRWQSKCFLQGNLILTACEWDSWPCKYTSSKITLKSVSRQPTLLCATEF